MLQLPKYIIMPSDSTARFPVLLGAIACDTAYYVCSYILKQNSSYNFFITFWVAGND